MGSVIGLILPWQGNSAPALSELWAAETGADEKGEGGTIVLGADEGLRETAAPKGTGREASLMSELKLRPPKTRKAKAPPFQRREGRATLKFRGKGETGWGGGSRSLAALRDDNLTWSFRHVLVRRSMIESLKEVLRRCAQGGIIGDSDSVRETHERPFCEGG
jgi:hypothetical protein